MNFEGGLLLDESVNLGDISISSFGTPLPAKGTPSFDDSPTTRPWSTAEDDESEDGRDVAPPSPLDDKVPAGSTEADEGAAPGSLPERDPTPSPERNPEPQTPSRRTKVQITMETERIVVSIEIFRLR